MYFSAGVKASVKARVWGFEVGGGEPVTPRAMPSHIRTSLKAY